MEGNNNSNMVILYELVYEFNAIQSKGQYALLGNWAMLFITREKTQNNGDNIQEKERMGREESSFFKFFTRYKQMEYIRRS